MCCKHIKTTWEVTEINGLQIFSNLSVVNNKIALKQENTLKQL